MRSEYLFRQGRARARHAHDEHGFGGLGAALADGGDRVLGVQAKHIVDETVATLAVILDRSFFQDLIGGSEAAERLVELADVIVVLADGKKQIRLLETIDAGVEQFL